MPPPFPGMDPFLEDPRLWPDVHHEIISEVRARLGKQLRPKYNVRIEERVYISDEVLPVRSLVVPDVRIGSPKQWEGPGFAPAIGETSVDVAEPIVATILLDAEIHEARLEIISRDDQLVVTVIEVLSPANKTQDAAGRRAFKTKRREVMNSSSHWVEIDLLRLGEEMALAQSLPPHDYLVHVSRVGDRPEGRFWPIRLSQRLPTVTIPLRPEDPDATLDLQDVLTSAYDRAGYDLTIDYTREPVPPLQGDWPAWADGRLREKGLR